MKIRRRRSLSAVCFIFHRTDGLMYIVFRYGQPPGNPSFSHLLLLFLTISCFSNLICQENVQNLGRGDGRGGDLHYIKSKTNQSVKCLWGSCSDQVSISSILTKPKSQYQNVPKKSHLFPQKLPFN